MKQRIAIILEREHAEWLLSKFDQIPEWMRGHLEPPQKALKEELEAVLGKLDDSDALLSGEDREHT